MKPMCALQPGIPSPTTIPQNWHIIIIDLQDCFFNIRLHPLSNVFDESKKLSCSVSSNRGTISNGLRGS